MQNIMMQISETEKCKLWYIHAVYSVNQEI